MSHVNDGSTFQEIEPELLRLTLDQMRTIVGLYDFRSTRDLAKYLRRDQSSVLKQLETMNDVFVTICGTRLTSDVRRGQPLEFTQTGKTIVELIRRFLGDSRSTVEKIRIDQGKKLTAASTTGNLELIARVWKRWNEEAKGGFELRLKQIRTFQVEEELNSRGSDLVFCGRLEGNGHALEDHASFEYIEWSAASGLCLLTNCDAKFDSVTPKEIIQRKLPLILPQAGIVYDYAGSLLHCNLKDLSPVAWVDDLNFGLGLLKHGLYDAYFFVVDTIADAVLKEQSKATAGSAKGRKLIKIQIKESKLHISSGLYRRRDANLYPPSHPINVCWNIFRQEAERRSKKP